MSIDSINPIGAAGVNPMQKSDTTGTSEPPPTDKAEPLGTSGPPRVIEDGMSTEDFLILKTDGGEKDPFANLDEVIQNIRDNVEEMGKALESLVEKIEKVSELSVGLQLLDKTFEAIEKYREGISSD